MLKPGVPLCPSCGVPISATFGGTATYKNLFWILFVDCQCEHCGHHAEAIWQHIDKDNSTCWQDDSCYFRILGVKIKAPNITQPLYEIPDFSIADYFSEYEAIVNSHDYFDF